MPGLKPLASLMLAGLLAAAVAGPASAGSIGLVIGDWRFALYQTPNGKDECPDGFLHDLTANYTAEYPTPEARKAREEKFGYYTNRGPLGENVFYHPTVIKDPLPFRHVAGKIGIGLNLDGETEGKGGGASLPHDNFISPDGEPGVDNQLYRVVGCTPGWRKGGGIAGPAQVYIRSETQNRILLEITEVDDEVNDDHVIVTTYRGMDLVAADANDKLIPWLSQRIDYRLGGRYINQFKGKIVNGVLTTEPGYFRMSYQERPDRTGERILKQARFKLKLTPEGATGLLGGYTDTEYWFLMYSKTWGAHKVADIEGWSGPATYAALQQFADWKDPETGAKGISTAYEVGFARTFIIHSKEGDAQVAERLEASRAKLAGAQRAPDRIASR